MNKYVLERCGKQSMWGRDGKEIETERSLHCRERWSWRHEHGERQANVNSLCTQWWRPSRGCCWGPCLGPQLGFVDVQGLYCHWGLFGCSWSLRLPKARLMSVGHAAAGMQTDLSGLCCPWGHGDVLDLAATEGHVWVSGPTASGFYVDVCGPNYHQRRCRW